MNIAGLYKTTLLDYPEHIATSIFTVGCDFCCPFCHNRDLVISREDRKTDLIPQEEILRFLESRKKILTGVCISGGEPTMQLDLKEFIRQIKAMGYAVKLDTNGHHPEVLKGLLSANLVDYIAMDIKNSTDKYAITTGCQYIDYNKIEKSIQLILDAGNTETPAISYEFRTTVIKELHTEVDLIEIGKRISGKGRYYLQSYEENGNVIQKGFHAYQPAEMRSLVENLASLGIPATLRGIA